MVAAAPKIAIIGAGPGGLMLASILHHNNIPCTIFERDTSAVARAQGGTLDLHEYSGQRALEAAGLLDGFRAVMRQGGDAMKMIRKDGTVLHESGGEDHDEATTGGDGVQKNEGPASKFVKGRPEIDRPALKDLLIASLPVDTVRWGSRVDAVTQVPGSKQWDVKLAAAAVAADDSPAPFDLVVGADGAWSHTRALLTAQQPLYSGITALDVWAPRVDEAAPAVSAFVGAGNCFMFEKDRALLFQRNGSGRDAKARCYACVKTHSATPLSPAELLGRLEPEAQVDWADARTREEFVERHFADWYPEVKSVLLAMTEEPVLRPLYMLPVGLTWESRPGVTLVGDAAHLMTPFAGVGVNVALMDALELAQGIVDCVKMGNINGDGLAAMVREYEKGMFKRSSAEAAKTEAAMNIQFQEGGMERMIEIISGGLQPEDLVFE
ncbi:putative Aromatic-ring hydroxylase-like [Rosellinia necatrix]|uniref:Putative Aromatic-ring hydroxylase-like n=1 Tax=Rosellinia necatrix TaxID=77044 RepID=A0A1W2THF0_ROSNE|nr:putative Aromatic-ring hydroxylase-like [Rosellinia necatrix]